MSLFWAFDEQATGVSTSRLQVPKRSKIWQEIGNGNVNNQTRSRREAEGRGAETTSTDEGEGGGVTTRMCTWRGGYAYERYRVSRDESPSNPAPLPAPAVPPTDHIVSGCDT